MVNSVNLLRWNPQKDCNLIKNVLKLAQVKLSK